MPTSPEDMMAAIELDPPGRTGKTLVQWAALDTLVRHRRRARRPPHVFPDGGLNP